ncbi:MAG: hypothetical protein ACREPR_24160 [Brasilonema sp.]
MEEESLTSEEYVSVMVRLLKPHIKIEPLDCEPSYYKVWIDGQFKGYWTSMGLAPQLFLYHKSKAWS